jgi:hypothetical protein
VQARRFAKWALKMAVLATLGLHGDEEPPESCDGYESDEDPHPTDSVATGAGAANSRLTKIGQDVPA